MGNKCAVGNKTFLINLINNSRAIFNSNVVFLRTGFQCGYDWIICFAIGSFNFLKKSNVKLNDITRTANKSSFQKYHICIQNSAMSLNATTWVKCSATSYLTHDTVKSGLSVKLRVSLAYLRWWHIRVTSSISWFIVCNLSYHNINDFIN